VYNIKVGCKEIGWGAVGWIDLALDRGMCQACEHGNVPLGSIQCGDFCVPEELLDSPEGVGSQAARQVGECCLHIRCFIVYT
jgi:hypothetical protein